MPFMLLALVLTFLAMVFLAWLFMWRRLPEQLDPQALRIARNVDLYRQRLTRLDDELKAELIDENEYNNLKTDLGRQLLHDVDQLHEAPVRQVQRRKWYWLLLPAPLLALLLYGAIGAWPDWQISQQLDKLSQSRTEQQYQARLQDVLGMMASRLKQRPDHVEYRLLLANHAMEQRDYQAATTHYGILAELLPEDDEILALYAQAEYLRADRSINETVARFMDRALQINPFNRTVLGLKGVHAMQSGDYASAVEAWEKLLSVLPPDSRQTEIIRQGIASARAQLPADQQQAAAADAASLAVDVALAGHLPALDGSLSVYVYARAADGPPMPLAVQKLTVAQLPATVTLSDEQAMMAQMTMSGFDNIVVGARVSISGEARAATGDWQVEETLNNWRQLNDIQLVIAEQID